MKSFQTFINWQNDLHWGPFEALRPAKNTNIDARLFGHVCALGIPTTVICVVLALWAVGTGFYYAQFRQMPPLPAVVGAPVHIVTHLWWLLLSAAAAFPLLSLPYVFCWNRRAADLRKIPVSEQVVLQAGVWPPPPERDPLGT